MTSVKERLNPKGVVAHSLRTIALEAGSRHATQLSEHSPRLSAPSVSLWLPPPVLFVVKVLPKAGREGRDMGPELASLYSVALWFPEDLGVILYDLPCLCCFSIAVGSSEF